MKKTLLIVAIAILSLVSCSKAKETYSTRIIQEWEIDASSYIDMGLSVAWASCNLGAKTPDAAGDFYAWAETAAKKSFSKTNYQYYEAMTGGRSYKFNKYGEDDRQTVLKKEDDAAHVVIGTGGWHIPTPEQFQELLDNCKWEWASYNGQLGMFVTSNINGASIFLPAAGYYNGGSLITANYYTELTFGFYQTNTIRYEGLTPEKEAEEEAGGAVLAKENWYQNIHVLQFCATSRTMTTGDRCFGRSIRPVKDLS